LQLSIILLSTDRVAAQALSDILTKPGHGVTVVADTDELVDQAAGYSLVIVDTVPLSTTIPEVIGRLRANEATAQHAILAVAQSDDMEARIELLVAGADDAITKPFDTTELEARVEAVALRFQRSRDRSLLPATTRAIGDARGRRTITVFSPKGGVGTTTIATNLAMVSAEAHPNQVLLIDLDLSFGQVASHLNLQPKQTLLELVRDEAALREPELFRTYAVHHASGVHLLAAPPSPQFASLITADHIEGILGRALESYEVIVVDAGSMLDDRMLAIFSRSDTVVVPVVPEIPALNAVHAMIENLSETGAVGAATMFVLNNIYARDLLRRADIENALGAKITSDLPYDPFVYLKAVNEGVPVVRGAARTLPAEKLRELATSVFGRVPTVVAEPTTATLPVPEPAPKERRGLFGLRRSS
jgi:pilus assembly protein CpaE